MKITFAITIFFALLVQTFSKAFVMADFYINRDAIEQELCENKDKPELQCKGGCALKKELEKENKKEIPQQLQEIKTFLKVERFTLINPTRPAKIVFGLVENDNRIFKNHIPVFRPPAC